MKLPSSLHIIPATWLWLFRFWHDCGRTSDKESKTENKTKPKQVPSNRNPQPHAIAKQAQLLDFSTPAVQASMIKDALDRDGHKPKEQVEHSGAVGSNVVFRFGDKIAEDDI